MNVNTYLKINLKGSIKINLKGTIKTDLFTLSRILVFITIHTPIVVKIRYYVLLKEPALNLVYIYYCYNRYLTYQYIIIGKSYKILIS